MIGDHLDKYSVQSLMDAALAMVPDTVDKRQGSIIWDALAAGLVQLAEAFIELRSFYLDAYVMTAEGEALEMRVAERGIVRYHATRAVKLGVFTTASGDPATIPIGARFSTTSDTAPLIYIAIEAHSIDNVIQPGQYRLMCETIGTAGNDYTGPLLPITVITGLATAIMTDLLIPAQDAENDADLLARYLEIVNYPPFGGNIAHYRQWTLAINGVGTVQIYPIWRGAGTVKVSVIGADYNPASAALIDIVQTILDPEENHGIGLGLAPIGHTVTVSTPEAVVVDIEANITLNGATIGQIQTEVEAAIAEYLLELRRQFGGTNSSYVLNVYQSRIIAAIVTVPGVLNVTELFINGTDADLILTETAELQQVPVMGEVLLHEV